VAASLASTVTASPCRTSLSGTNASAAAPTRSPGLSLRAYAALAYYFAHREEIDASIREGRAFIEEMRRKTPSKLRQKLEGEG